MRYVIWGIVNRGQTDEGKKRSRGVHDTAITENENCKKWKQGNGGSSSNMSMVGATIQEWSQINQ